MGALLRSSLALGTAVPCDPIFHVRGFFFFHITSLWDFQNSNIFKIKSLGPVYGTLFGGSLKCFLRNI